MHVRERELQYKHTLSVVSPIRRDTAGAFWALWDDKGICTIAGASQRMWYWILGGGSSIHMLARIWEFPGECELFKKWKVLYENLCYFWEHITQQHERNETLYCMFRRWKRSLCFSCDFFNRCKGRIEQIFWICACQTTSCFEGLRMWMNNLSEQWPVTWLSLLLSFMAIPCFGITITRRPMEFLASVIYTLILHFYCGARSFPLYCDIHPSYRLQIIKKETI